MRSKLILAAFMALTVYTVNGQAGGTPAKEAPAKEGALDPKVQIAQWNVNHAFRVYQAARSLNDLNAAKEALLDILVEVPGNDSIVFELGAMYFQLQMYQSSAICATRVLSVNNKHLGAMEIAALSYENLGANDKALENYEQLFLATDDFNALYKSALLQYDLGRFVESSNNIEILLGRKEADELKIPLVVDGNKQKEYPMRALLLNLKGMSKIAQGDKVSAKAAFEAAIKMAPDFTSAKEQLANLDK